MSTGCVLSPLLLTLMTHECCVRFDTNHIFKYADNTTVKGLIGDKDELAYRKEVKHLVDWCNLNNLDLHGGKTRRSLSFSGGSRPPTLFST